MLVEAGRWEVSSEEEGSAALARSGYRFEATRAPFAMSAAEFRFALQ